MTTMPTIGTGWKVDDSTLGARLALVRQKMDWNIKEAARECGLPAASWRTWERDGVKPRDITEIAAVIADRTGADYGWLLAGPRLERGQPILQSFTPTDRTRPNGHPKRTTPRTSTRRPGRVSTANTASVPYIEDNATPPNSHPKRTSANGETRRTGRVVAVATQYGERTADAATRRETAKVGA